MSHKKETLVFIVSLLLTGAAIVGAAQLYDHIRLQRLLNNRISAGEKVLMATATSQEKEAAARAVVLGEYQAAIAQLETALEKNRNDPEALIYLNNARIGTEKSYTLVASVPIGFHLNPARELLRGVAQVQQETNQGGGIEGIPLKILIANDDNDPPVAQQLARAYARNHDILGVVGHFGSDASLAAAQVYQKEGLVMISPTSTSVELSGKGKYIFRTVPSDRFAGSVLARYFLDTVQQQKAAVFYNSKSNYSQSLKTVFTTELYAQGGEVVAEFDFADRDFQAVEAVKIALAQNTEALMLAPDTTTLEQALRVVQVNDSRLPLLAGDSAYKSETLEIGRRDAVGMAIAVPWYSLSEPDSEFARTTRQLWGGDVNWRTALAYDATKAFTTAMAVNPTRQGMQAALSDPNFTATGAFGEIRFLPSGDRNQAVQLVTVAPGVRTSFDYEFVPLQD
jgi:branched-chain amino acid transport system substrate-binding protein